MMLAASYWAPSFEVLDARFEALDGSIIVAKSLVELSV